MLNGTQANEIHKFFLNSLKLSINGYQDRVNTLRAARDLPNEEISKQAKSYSINNNDMRIIYAAFQAATAHTQAKVKVTQENIGEITNAIHDYQVKILPDLLNGYDPHRSLIPWLTIKANINKLDEAIKVEDFKTKYSTELKLIGLSLGLIGGVLAIGFFAILNGVNASEFTPSSHSM